MRNVVAAGDFSQGFASIATSDGFRNLMLRQLGLSPKL
jgi:hypothetical protein